MEDGTLQQRQESLIGSEIVIRSQLGARKPEQRNADDARATRSGPGISPPAMMAAQGSDQEYGAGEEHNSPLFVSSGSSTPAQSASNTISNETTRCRGGIAVVVPPVERRWEYLVFPDETRVREIIEEIDNEELQYLVAFDDGHEAKVIFTRLVNLVNGAAALEAFNGQSFGQDQSDSGPPTAMAPRRQAQYRQNRADGFVDSSKLDFSDDDELAGTEFTKPQSTRSRGLLSAPRPPQGGRSTRKFISRSASSRSLSSSQDTASETAGFHRLGRKTTRARLARSTRSMTARRVNYKDILDEDEIDTESSDDSLPTLGKRKRRQASATHGARKTRIVFRGLRPQETAPPEGTRRSDRTGRSLRNMRERTENDIPEGLASKSGIKAVGAKEKFKRLPSNNEFRLRHCHTCDSCYASGDSDEKGQLIYCQGCTLSYHIQCLGPRGAREHLVTKIEDGNFVLQCRRCIGTAKKKDNMAPEQGRCQICKESSEACSPFRDRKSSKQEQKDREENGGEDPIVEIASGLINEINNVLFRCARCYRAFHMHHLSPKAEEDKLLDDSEEDLAAQRFSEYCRDWSCKECESAPAEIDTLVAWRPVNEESYISGCSTELVNEDDKEYLVKWKGFSYFRTMWMPGAWVWGVTAAAMRKAFAKRDNGANLPRMRTEDAIPEEYLRIDIVLDVRYTNAVSVHGEKIDKARIKEVKEALIKFKGLGYEDVVWEEPPEPDDGERWTDFVSAYDDWVLGRYVQLPNQHNLKKHVDKVRAQHFGERVELKAQPEGLTGGQLMDYQMDGVNWLYYQWHKSQNAILADEMGLGKTIQIIGFLAAMKQVHKAWPFLIVVPNSTCANWRREIKQWAPSLRVVTYFGSSEARKLAFKYELFPENAKDLRCHVVVTSYDTAQDDSCQKSFRKVPWQGLIVDEGQRLKNDKSILYSTLGAMKIPFKVLLTGTPLQNNPRELFNLLQFLDNSINAQAMDEEYATLTKENVPQLHELLRPFFLRRTKAQVLTFLPPMAQIIIPVTLSVVQKKLYKSVLAKNPDLIKAIFGGEKKALKQADRYNLNNILMQLRKCLCHPFVYSKAIEERTVNTVVSHRNLVEASSKLQLLEIMLPKLQERGHRALIFSQFLNMLDIVEDFLDGLGLPYQRLDGSMNSLQKQKRIDQFNAPDSPLFAFLLSTRAGGVGINLATADTVIILDPDFNPHQDIQALSRAHRIGQKKKVLIFQLMTRATAEEKIMQIGKKKMALDHVLIEQMDADDDAGMDLESILRHGAEALFGNDDTLEIHYDASSVDKLLDRSQIENTNVGTDNSAESQFSFARIWANEKGNLEEGLQDSSRSDQKAPDPNIWENILKEREREAAQEAAARVEALGRGKRKRQTIDYTKHSMRGIEFESPVKYAEQSDSDTDFQARGAESDGEESAEEDRRNHISPQELQNVEASPSRGKVEPQGSPPSGKIRTFQRAQLPAQAPHRVHTPQAVARTSMGESKLADTQASCLACDGLHPKGQCPLKIAGVENCGLCGLAHYGHKRTCPHLNSELQCRTMLAELKNSTESKELVKRAQEYLRGVIGGIVRKEKKMEARKNAANGANVAQRTPNDHVMDGHTSTRPTSDTGGGQDASGDASGASRSNSGHQRREENGQSGSAFPIQAPGDM